MKGIKHDNIVPFYGVSTTVSDFCLVFPWYHNGNIMDYTRKNPNANRYDLASTFRVKARSQSLLGSHEQLSGAVNGLLFLHGNRLVHGALRPVRSTSFLLNSVNTMDRVTY